MSIILRRQVTTTSPNRTMRKMRTAAQGVLKSPMAPLNSFRARSLPKCAAKVLTASDSSAAHTMEQDRHSLGYKVLAKSAVMLSFRGFIARRDDATSRVPLSAATAGKFHLRAPKQITLPFGDNRRFRQEERPAVGSLKPLPVADCAGECAAHMSEKLRLEEVVRQARNSPR